MRSGLVVYATLALNRTNISKCFNYVNLGRKINTVKDLAPELRRDNLRFADNVVLITPNISQARRMLDDFDKACGKIGLRVNPTQTMLLKNGLVSHAPFTLNGTNISECSSYIYLGREINMMNDLAPELSRRKRVAWRAFVSIEDVMKKTNNNDSLPTFCLSGASCFNVCA
ncbi:unnamed protein product [Angiostrongylus costaricensis]|uniref:Reverse transcriptase domain-containing protein n=1 Tax=Angiostrongylus costaricensis TaxID=334426 RepID=A0A0R3Q2F2_ANGCS|nr:unnamed protein product [Angiostrongylus costaricensis]